MEDLSKKNLEKINELKEKFNQNLKELEEKFNNKLQDSMTEMKSEFLSSKNQVIELIEIKEKVLKSIFNELKEEYLSEKSRINSDLEEIKNQLDVHKISKELFEKQFIDKVKNLVFFEVRNICRNKENEILMTLWINELKEVTKNLDKLKDTTITNLKIQIDEILTMIQAIKQRIIV